MSKTVAGEKFKKIMIKSENGKEYLDRAVKQMKGVSKK